jgi:hypothetical protein
LDTLSANHASEFGGDIGKLASYATGFVSSQMHSLIHEVCEHKAQLIATGKDAIAGHAAAFLVGQRFP